MYEFLPTLITAPLDSFFMFFGVDIQTDLLKFSTFITGLLGAVEPFNDLFMLMIVFLTNKHSFRHDLSFFTLICGYAPLALVSTAWLANEVVMIYQGPYD
jgi:hypothetical protein